MKKFISLLLTLLMIMLCSVNAFAADKGSAASGKTIVSEGDWVYESINGGADWELDGYAGNGGKVVIPRLYRDKMVISIGSHCFLNNTTVEEVTTSSPLWTVDEYAFMNCTLLKSFECNFALKEIGVGAFIGTESLKKINLEDSVVTIIKPHAFMNSGISRVELPSTCTEIQGYAFAQCPSLRYVKIPDSVTTIADTAFSNSDNLVIVCSPDSYAAQYAASKGIDCIAADDFVLGDVNNDKKVTIRDVTLIQLHLVGRQGCVFDKKKLAAADVSGDGDVNINDATYIQLYKVGKIKSFDDIS